MLKIDSRTQSGTCQPERQIKKKAPFYNEALKGSLNLKVSKGPEETNGRNKFVSDD